MGAVTPSFIHGLETRMEAIITNNYAALSKKTWWQNVAKVKDSVTKVERLVWLAETAKIRQLTPGSMHFEDLVSQYQDLVSEFAGDGFQLTKEQMEDVYNGQPGGEALDLAGSWARQIAHQAAYWPQRLIADAILAGEDATSVTYDNLPFFNTGHYVNGLNDEDGTFSNIINGTTLNAAGLGAAAPAIDDSVTLDVALKNLQRIKAFLATIKQGNGRDPRNLELKGLLLPSALMGNAVQLTNAKTIAQAAASGGGGADVEAVISFLGLGQPIEAPELGSAFGGSDTTFYVIAGSADPEPDSLIYVNREPFNVLFHGPEASAELARKRKLQWLTGGRNAAGYGHPYKLFKVVAA